MEYKREEEVTTNGDGGLCGAFVHHLLRHYT